MDERGVETCRRAGDQSGVVGAHGGACFIRGVEGVENIIPEVLNGQPQMGLSPPPPPHKEELAIRWDLLLIKGPKIF